MDKNKNRILTGVSIFCLTANAFGQKSDILTSNPMDFEQKADSITCIVSGTVIDRPESTYALIIEAGKDFRIHPVYEAPISDGKFSLTIKDPRPLAYEVIFDD